MTLPRYDAELHPGPETYQPRGHEYRLHHASAEIPGGVLYSRDEAIERWSINGDVLAVLTMPGSDGQPGKRYGIVDHGSFDRSHPPAAFAASGEPLHFLGTASERYALVGLGFGTKDLIVTYLPLPTGQTDLGRNHERESYLLGMAPGEDNVGAISRQHFSISLDESEKKFSLTDHSTHGMIVEQTGVNNREKIGHHLTTTSSLGDLAIGVSSDRIPAQESSRPVLEQAAANIHGFINYYGRVRLTTDKEVADARGVLSQAGRDLPAKLGFTRHRYTMSPNQDGFLPENDPGQKTKADEFFKVVYDEEGGEWLLKYAGLTSIRADGEDVIGDALALQRSEEEVAASRVASALGYPVPETVLTAPEIEGDRSTRAYNGYIAYRFIPQSMDHSLYTRSGPSATELSPIANPEDVEFRPIFNALIGSRGDGEHQGIVSQDTGVYYAQDLGVSSELPYKNSSHQYKNWREALHAEMDYYVHKDWYQPAVPRTDANSREKFDQYFAAMRLLSIEQVQEILSPATPLMRKELARLSKAIADRARVLVEMYDSGYFDAMLQH